jgi:glucokinase
MIHGEKKLAIGVDIGGTNLKFGLVTNEGEVIEDVSLPVHKNNDLSADIHHICEDINQFIRKHDLHQKLAGIGVSCPGVLDLENGVVKFAINLKWSNLNLAKILQENTRLPVYMEYDAIAGALGEKMYGVAKTLSHFLYICIGTGVGASLYTNDNFYSFENGPAINLGHTTVVHDGEWCKCGNRGCLEKYVSAPAISNRYLMLQDAQNSEIQLPNMNSSLVYQAALSGDFNARKILQDAGELLGISMINSLNLYGINTIVIGGGLSQATSYFLETAKRVVAERYENHSKSKVSIRQAQFPTKSGLLGGAAKVFKQGRM